LFFGRAAFGNPCHQSLDIQAQFVREIGLGAPPPKNKHYTTAGSLTTILKLADMGTMFGLSLRLLGSPNIIQINREKIAG
jgi:hypothetical protein